MNAALPSAGCQVAPGASQSGTLQWTFSSSSCGNFSLIVDRSYTTLSGDGVTQLEGTRITIDYPYTWYAARVFGFRAFFFPRTISANAIMMNAP